jgi:molecular chaperone HtpG
MSSDTVSAIKLSSERPFEAEVSRLLELMVHSVYSSREIFLRELVSNASDALDKLRYLSLTDSSLASAATDPAIRIRADKDKRTLTVADNGIGMDETELASNLGTIARSGTKAFLAKLDDPKKAEGQIGQFGVGFYSVFMVADRVEVLSRKAGLPAAHVWESDGKAGFTIRPADAIEAAAVPNGTRVTLHLKEDAADVLDDAEIERLVRAYSDHILFPVKLWEGQGKERQVNRASALWTRSKSELKPEDYKDFYTQALGHYDEPAATIHYRAEGRTEYAVLLFVPRSKPFNLYDPNRKGHVRFYVRRVFISDDVELLPPYLRFVEGVIDSQDMPLNISREMLQKRPEVAQIRKAVTGKVLSEIASFAAKDAEGYLKVWETFGAVLKEGLYEDPERRDALLELARFRTTASGEGWRSLKDYVASLKESQTAIYYATGESHEKLKSSPQLEGFRARGVEVVLLADPIDSFWVMSALGFDGKPFKSVTKGDSDLQAIPLASALPDSSSEPGNAGEIAAALQETLKDAVTAVRLSKRLVESPACLVAPEGGPDRELERLLARQGNEGLGTKPVLEINPSHSLVRILGEAHRSADRRRFEDLAWLVLDQARILEGGTPMEPGRFAERLNRLLTAGL